MEYMKQYSLLVLFFLFSGNAALTAENKSACKIKLNSMQKKYLRPSCSVPASAFKPSVVIYGEQSSGTLADEMMRQNIRSMANDDKILALIEGVGTGKAFAYEFNQSVAEPNI